MTNEQKNEVRQYLLSKKLPLDILIEVEDHVINQLEEVLLRNKVSFEDAFMQVKGLWQEDLQTEKYYNGNEIASFAKKIKDRETSKIFSKALISMALYFIALFCLSRLLKEDTFIDLFVYHLYIFGGFPGVLYLFNIGIYNYIQKFPKIKFSIYQTSNFLVVFIAFLLFSMGSKAGFYSQKVYSFFNSFNDGFSSLLICIVFSMFYFTGFYMQLSFVKSFKKNRQIFQNIIIEL